MGNRCEKCNKHKYVFKNTETNEKLCLWCGIKMQYELQGVKGIYRTLRFHTKSRWILSWRESLMQILFYIILVSLTATSILSAFYVIHIGQYWLLLTPIISLYAIIPLWKN